MPGSPVEMVMVTRIRELGTASAVTWIRVHALRLETGTHVTVCDTRDAGGELTEWFETARRRSKR